MRVKVILMLVLLSAFGILAAANISLISESLPRLGDVSGFVKYGDYGLFYGRYQDLSILDLSAGASPYSIATYNSTAAEGRCRELHVWGNKAYLVFQNEIEIVSLADIRQPVLQASFAMAGYCLVQIHNGNLYTLGSSGILSSYSLNNPLLPELLDALDTGLQSALYLLAGDGFMVCQKDYLCIVDIANPADLGLCESIQYNEDGSHYNSSVAVSGKYLYCNDLSEINVYSLQNLCSPTQVGTLTLDCTDLRFQTYIYDNVLWSLYIDGAEDIEEIGLMAVDLSVPSAPAQLLKQTITEEIGNVFGMGEFMCASGNLLYLNHDPFYLTIFDISGGVLTGLDTRYPLNSVSKIYAKDQRIVGINQFIQLLDFNQDQSLYVQSQFEPETQGLDAVQIMDDLLLCSALTYPDDAPRLTIYDLQSGNISGSILMPCVGYEYPRTTQDIQRYENYALVSNGEGGFYCIDLSDPTQPEQKFTINGYSYTSATASAGELWLAYYRDDWWGDFVQRISCYDISEPSNPVLKYNIEGGFMARKLLKVGDYLYALSWNQLECYHLGNDSVIEHSEYSMAAGEGADMQSLGKGLLIGTKEGMKVFSLKDPLHPVIVGDYPFEMENPATYPWDYPYYPDTAFAVSNSKILVANGWSLKCFDASLAAFLCEDSPYINSAKLIAFPNPAREKISFCFNKGTEGTAVLELYNIRGQKLIAKSFTSAADGLVLNKLDLKDDSGKRLAAGVYILKVKHGSSQQVCKIAVLP